MTILMSLRPPAQSRREMQFERQYSTSGKIRRMNSFSCAKARAAVKAALSALLIVNERERIIGCIVGAAS